jgi:hypothetical protein
VPTLELNIKAKRVAPPPAPKSTEKLIAEAINDLVLEVGKQYITNDGAVVGPMEPPKGPWQHQPWLAAPVPEAWKKTYPFGMYLMWEIDGGAFVGHNKINPRSIKEEWHPTYDLEQAWRAGKQLEYYDIHAGIWKPWFVYSVGLINATFGPNSESARGFWKKNYGVLINEDFKVRVKP